MAAMSPRPHILVVNGRKVSNPVFVLGGPHSGTELIARALKRTAGLHVTIGQPALANVVYALARSPSIQRGRAEATATVLRDALAQAWRLTPDACLACLPACRQAQPAGAITCAGERPVERYGDASPELIYCAEALVAAFPDARLVQVVRDGRAVVAAMLADPIELAWLRSGVANVDSEFPNPFYGIETEPDRAAWAGLSAAGRCAMRWRGSLHEMARLRRRLDGERLTTFRYEQIVAEPTRAALALAEFIGTPVEGLEMPGEAPDGWRAALAQAQLTEIEKVAGPQLRRVGYAD